MEEEKKEETINEVQEEIKETPEKGKKSKKKGVLTTVIIVLVFVVAILGVALGTKYFAKPKKTNKIQNTQKAVSELRLKGNGLEDFDLYFMKLENEKVNKVYSPLSIKYALAMLNEGTAGDSHNQISAVIGDYKAKKYNNNEHMSFANALFIKNAFKDATKQTYIDKLSTDYDAEVIYDSFENASNINSWISNKTFKLIEQLLDDDTVQQAQFFIVNALAIDMNWITRIQASSAQLPEGMKQNRYSVKYLNENYSDYISTIEGEEYPKMTFNGKENIKSVIVGASFNRYDIITELGEDEIRRIVTEKYQEYLDNGGEDCGIDFEEFINAYIKNLGENYKKEAVSTDFSIYTDDEVKVFAKDLQTYDGTTLQYIGIMPKETALNKYIDDLTAEKVSGIIDKLKEVKYDNFKEGVVTNIKGNIPLFKYEFELQLMDDLKKLGINDIFNQNKANLSNITSQKGMYIFSAKHKANIEFSNDGIKAAAATAFGGAGAAKCGTFNYEFEVPVEKIDITFDKPYLYIIRDKTTGEVWFTGTVYNPIEA